MRSELVTLGVESQDKDMSEIMTRGRHSQAGSASESR